MDRSPPREVTGPAPVDTAICNGTAFSAPRSSSTRTHRANHARSMQARPRRSLGPIRRVIRAISVSVRRPPSLGANPFFPADRSSSHSVLTGASIGNSSGACVEPLLTLCVICFSLIEACKLPELRCRVNVAYPLTWLFSLCSRCAKCHSLVEHNTNLLLLSDGSPVCENCSYSCMICQKPIHNEAIVTGTSRASARSTGF